MRVFLDTNVLVSAFTARGLSADVFRLVLAEHELLTGEVNLSELRRALRDRLHVPPASISSVERLLREHTVVARPGARPPNVLLRAGDSLAASGMLEKPLVRRSSATPPRGQGLGDRQVPRLRVPALPLSLRPPRARDGHYSAGLPAKVLEIAIRDRDDEWVLASAVAGGADVLVTGDKDLLSLGKNAPLPILNPRGFWELTRQSR